jgi:hypothetical protein
VCIGFGGRSTVICACHGFVDFDVPLLVRLSFTNGDVLPRARHGIASLGSSSSATLGSR